MCVDAVTVGGVVTICVRVPVRGCMAVGGSPLICDIDELDGKEDKGVVNRHYMVYIELGEWSQRLFHGRKDEADVSRRRHLQCQAILHGLREP